MVRIKKQYKQPDGTLIEVEGTEEEIERFEKKQQKQKATIEAEQRKKTILYGKDLEEIRKIVREEIAAARIANTHTTYEYRYVPYYPVNPYWHQPLNPWYQPNVIWMGNSNMAEQSSGFINSDSSNKFTLSVGDVSAGSITCTNTDASQWFRANSQPPDEAVNVYSVAKNEVEPTNAVWNAFDEAKPTCCGGAMQTGQVWSGVVNGWNGHASAGNYLMSPRS